MIFAAVDTKTLFIAGGAILLLVIVIIIFSRPKKTEILPFCYISNQNGQIVFYIYQQDNSFTVMNALDPNLAPVVFSEWSEVSDYVQLTKNEIFYIKKDND